MRLRFREAGIKRLEAVASSKISAEKHLLEERSELLKEIEVLRTQVDRNQEVTRFAMENLKLKEELRRQDFSYICLGFCILISSSISKVFIYLCTFYIEIYDEFNQFISGICFWKVNLLSMMIHSL